MEDNSLNSRIPNLFVYTLSGMHVYHDYYSNQPLDEYLAQKLELPIETFYLTGNLPRITLCLRVQGGHAGFGRAMKQEGERRSRRLPLHKDACRTLSGQRIGALKARRRILELREQIAILEKKRAEAKEIKRRSNTKKEQANVEKKEQEIQETVVKAFMFGSKINHQEEQNQEPQSQEQQSSVFDIDVSELFDA